MPGPAGTALRLLAELDAADGRLNAVSAERAGACERRGDITWVTAPPAGWFTRYEQATGEREAAARAFWDYLRRPGAMAEELAAAAILDPRWPWGRVDRNWPYVPPRRP
jgi:hypothetical protein